MTDPPAEGQRLGLGSWRLEEGDDARAPSDRGIAALEPSARSIQTIAVLGAGAMGAGIAQVALTAGREVILYDISSASLDRARERIIAGLEKSSSGLKAPRSG